MPRRKTIVYIGNFTHPHCTEVHIARTLADAGVRVIRLQENKVQLREIRALGKQADLVLYTRTWGLPKEAISVWRELEAAGVPTASYHLDLYVGLKRESTLEGDPFWATGICFTPDGDPASAEVFASHGVNHVYIPPAVFKGECVTGRVRPEFTNDVCFVGSYPYPHAEWPYRDQLVEALMARYGDKFTRYGAGARTVRNQDLNDVYASTRVVVGDSLCLGFTKPWYWSDRPYETVGRGGTLIMPRIEGLETHFTDREHLRFYDFNDYDALFSAIDELISNPAEATRIAQTGRVHVRDNHTYHNRLQQALKHVDDFKKAM